MLVRIQGISELQNQIYYDYDTDAVPLGQGGMGIVYPGRCFRVDNPNEYIEVAIKLMTDTSPDMIKRAMREASIQIDDPNLLRMYGFIPNMEPDPYTKEMRPKYYMVMERLDGVSLENLLDGVFCTKNGTDISAARELYDLGMRDRTSFTLKIMNPILRGVNRLHQAGYIHRDLDPSNIMITQSDEIKIIDYGVCKPVSSGVTDTKLTQTGAIIGKVDYAAPELLTGDVSHHNFTTDIYALGIMIYRLFVGNLPFTGDNTAVMKSHLTEAVPVENISDPIIRKIVQKATSKAQEDRYQSVDDMLADMETCCIGTARADCGGSVRAHIGEDMPSHTSALSWIVPAVVGLAAGIAVAFIM